MKPEAYFEATQFDQNVGNQVTDNAQKLWALGAEAVLLAAMKQDVDSLASIASIHHKMRDEVLELDYIAQINKHVTPGWFVQRCFKRQAEVQEEGRFTEFEDVRHLLACRHIVEVSNFFRHHMVEGRGETTLSFNLRMLKHVLMPTLRMVAVDLQRTKTDNDRHTFKCNGTELTEPASSDHSGDQPVTHLHASLLELDTWVSLFYLVTERKLPFIPIQAGPSSEYKAHATSAKNMNADILLVKDDGTEVVPIQVKVQRHDSMSYDESVVITDSNTLGVKSTAPAIVKLDNRARTRLVDTFHAGRIMNKVCTAQSRPKPPKILRDIVGYEISPHLYREITDSGHHKLEK